MLLFKSFYFQPVFKIFLLFSAVQVSYFIDNSFTYLNLFLFVVNQY